MSTRIEIYRAGDRGWRWRMWHKGRITAESCELYRRKPILLRSLLRLMVSLSTHDYYLDDQSLRAKGATLQPPRRRVSRRDRLEREWRRLARMEATGEIKETQLARLEELTAMRAKSLSPRRKRAHREKP